MKPAQSEARGCRGCRVRWEGQRLVGAGNHSCQVNHPDQAREEGPCGHRQQAAQPEWGSDCPRPARHERDRARCHCRGHEGDGDEVGGRSDQRQPPEGQQGDRQRGRLRRERNAQAFAKRAGEPGRAVVQSLRKRRCPRHQPGRGRRRKLEPRVADRARLNDQHCGDGPRQPDHRPRAAPALDREQRHAGHHRSPDHRRRGSGKERVRDDRAQRDDGPAPPTEQPTQQRRHGRGHDGDVPARDCHDMTHAGRREVCGHVLVDAIAQPDQDRSRESALRLGQDTLERVAGRLPKVLQRSRRGVVVLDERQVRGLAEGGDTLRREPQVVFALGQRPEATGPANSVSGDEPGVCGELRRAREWRLRQLDRRDL